MAGAGAGDSSRNNNDVNANFKLGFVRVAVFDNFDASFFLISSNFFRV